MEAEPRLAKQVGVRWLEEAVTPEQREAFEERAAIREYDGGYPRAEAERLALEDIKKREAKP